MFKGHASTYKSLIYHNHGLASSKEDQERKSSHLMHSLIHIRVSNLHVQYNKKLQTN